MLKASSAYAHLEEEFTRKMREEGKPVPSVEFHMPLVTSNRVMGGASHGCKIYPDTHDHGRDQTDGTLVFVPLCPAAGGQTLVSS